MEFEKQIYYAKKIIEITQDELVMEFKFLVHAIYSLKPKPVRESDHKHITFATEGRYFYYREKELIELFKNEDSGTTDLLLHSLIHCLYCHPFLADKRRKHDIWDIACDICAWDLLNSLRGKSDPERRKQVDHFHANVKNLSATEVYFYLLKEQKRGNLWEADKRRLKQLFHVDDHDLWYLPRKENLQGQNGKTYYDDLMKVWQKLGDFVKTKQAISKSSEGKKQGDEPGEMQLPMDRVEKEHIDYSEFLRKFAAVKERMKVDVDGFDYAVYVYGLELYEDMPLIEPLEYKELHSIRTFVIAIDTSGSCEEKLIRTFLSKTYAILSSAVFEDNSLEVHIMQCDAMVQSDTLIKSVDDLRNYMDSLTISGRGGTDFRPVFERIKKLKEKGELRDLEGLLYFTDGYGSFPSADPGYKTAFLFAEPGGNRKVPSWALSILLYEEDFDEHFTSEG